MVQEMSHYEQIMMDVEARRQAEMLKDTPEGAWYRIQEVARRGGSRDELLPKDREKFDLYVEGLKMTGFGHYIDPEFEKRDKPFTI